MSVPPSPEPLSPPEPQVMPPEPQVIPPQAPPGPETIPLPQPPATRATPERLVQLMITICNRLERLEGLVERLDKQAERTSRRLDSAECRWVGFNDRLALLTMLTGNLPSLQKLVLAMLAVAAVAVVLTGLGIFLAAHWPGLITLLF